ncbi:MAG: hypothetical protein SPD11_10340 [Sphaerochaetaceae bacterium]|nr:hypothetical protein [Sphaerochaetaceae bacterium]
MDKTFFLDSFLVSGPVETLYHDAAVDRDQMRYEKYLRSRIAKKDIEYPGRFSNMDGTGLCGKPWHYHFSYGNAFVDYSSFYSMLTSITLDACTMLHSERNVEKKLVLWTYAAVTVWCNGEKVCEIDTPVYKPMLKRDFTVKLDEGENEIYVVLQNLGVRDTRTIFGIEVLDPRGIACTVPPHPGRDEYLSAVSWLSGVVLGGRTLRFPSDAADGARIGYDSHSPDYALVSTRKVWHDISGLLSFECESGNPYVIVETNAGGQKLTRSFEICDMVKPVYSEDLTCTGNYRRMLSAIASADGLSRGDKFGFYIQNILARKALGYENPRDREYFLTTLQQISDRYDCSDFLISGVIRYMKNYPVEADLQALIDEVLLDYRYWMTMNGSDAMCFWSENHSLLFYSCAMLVGGMYPDSYFHRAAMTGRELAEFGRRLTLEWFDDLDRYGFEEFLSTVYMNVTFACLLNIIDYAEPDVAERAVKTTDRMLRMLASHTFDGSIIAPMGRVYRGVINPCKQGAQALMNLANPSVPTSFGEGWLSYYATSSYRIPEDIEVLMSTPFDIGYSTGNALVKLKKTGDYCISSVQSPRLDGHERWPNCTLVPSDGCHEDSHWYTKSFNERFHGTTFFQPGVYGYQQHMWTAALSCEAIVFTNHPGATCDDSSMRPGYWYGNGVMPALRQEGSLLAVIYDIPDTHPIRFTHVFLPECKFDLVERAGHWVFAQKNSGYMALWSSGDMVPYDDELSDCELRVYDSKSAYLCLVGSASEDGRFSEFRAKALALIPTFGAKENALSVSGLPFLTFVAAHDETQYV